jgi:hypothetical protein
MSDIAYHYTKVCALSGIFRRDTLLPSPPLAAYDLCREAVEADPSRHGFQVWRRHSQRYFYHEPFPHSVDTKGSVVVGWYEGERFAVPLSRASWCGSALGYLPPGLVDVGYAYRLIINLHGLDVFTWQEFDRRTNVPSPYRRHIGKLSRDKGDDMADWLFVLGAVSLPRHLLGLEQYHQGRWTSFDEVAERLPLKEMFAGRPSREPKRPRFRSSFIRSSVGRVRASLFGMVFGEDGQWVADHLWVRQTWDHLRPGDPVEFFATVVPYRRQDGTESYTLGEVNGLIVLGKDALLPSIPQVGVKKRPG